MPAIVRLNKQGLNDLIENIRNNGNSPPPELESIMAEINEDERYSRPVRRREAAPRVMVEEPTTEQRLEAEVGELFPGGVITEKILTDVIAYAREYTLEELKKMAREAGLSLSSDKKALAAKLIAMGIK